MAQVLLEMAQVLLEMAQVLLEMAQVLLEMAQFLLRFITKTLSMYFDRIQIAGVNTAKMKRSLQIM